MADSRLLQEIFSGSSAMRLQVVGADMVMGRVQSPGSDVVTLRGLPASVTRYALNPPPPPPITVQNQRLTRHSSVLHGALLVRVTAAFPRYLGPVSLGRA